jgi:GT2 family glycosyltransferase
VDLSIIIVNYNVKEFLQNLIHSINKAAKNFSFEIIIVDNASDDGSEQFIKEKFPEVKLICNSYNEGFSKANNKGLSIASGKYILLINPDTLVSEDTFQKMIEFFESYPQAGMAGCKILNPDGSLQLACRRSFPGPWTSFCKVTGLSSLFPKSKLFARYNLTYLDENETYEVDAISGSFMMMRRDAYEKVGGLDEQFFMYGEDLDLCYRFQKSGYKVFYVHSTQIIHYKGESTKRSSFDETKVFYDAMDLFVKKHLSSSFIVEIILRSAVVLRKFFAFVGRRKLIFSSMLIDLIIFDLTLFAASKIYSSFGHWRGFPPSSYLIILTTPAIIHIIIASILRVYKRDTLSVIKNLGAVLFSFFIISSLTFFFKQYAFSRATLLIAYLLLFFSLSLWRIFVKIFFKIGLKGENLIRKKSLVVGTGEKAVSIASKLKMKNIDLHFVSGLIGLNASDIGKNIGGFDVIGSLENIKKVVRERKIDEIIFLSDEIPYNKMMSIVSVCQSENVDFKVIGSSLDFLVGKTSVSLLDDLPLIDINFNISNPLFKLIKALFDYSLATFVLFFIFPFIYLTIKLTGKQSEFSNFVLKVPRIFSGKVSFVGPKHGTGKENLFLGKKGLTGFWYIEDGETRENEKTDLFYAKNQNIWLDIEILGRTLSKMWGSKK